MNKNKLILISSAIEEIAQYSDTSFEDVVNSLIGVVFDAEEGEEIIRDYEEVRKGLG